MKQKQEEGSGDGVICLDTIVEKMAREAGRELEEIRHRSVVVSLKSAAKRALGRAGGWADSKDLIFWPAGLLMLGLLEAGHDREVEDYLDGWFKDGMPVQNPDDALTGEVLLRLYEKYESRIIPVDDRAADTAVPEEGASGGAASGGAVSGGAILSGAVSGGSASSDAASGSLGPGKNEDTGSGIEGNLSLYKTGADRIYSYLMSCRRDREGSIVYGQRSSNQYIFADGAGQISMFLAHYGRLFGQEAALADAKKQLDNFYSHGMDRLKSGRGLPYHGYDAGSGTCYGIIGWGRAVGWFMFGLAEYALPGLSGNFGSGEVDPVYVRRLQELTDACAMRTRSDGMFSWQLDCYEGPADSSATGMLFWALNRVCEADASGIIVTDFLRKSVDAGAQALLSYIGDDGKVGQASAECIDFGEYRQIYGNYPWGQGAGLMFLASYNNRRHRQ